MPQSIAAGVAPVDTRVDALLGQLIAHTSTLICSRITYALGRYLCEECRAEWVSGESPTHQRGCATGDVNRVLGDLAEALAERACTNRERSSAEPAHDAGAAAEERSRGAFDYGEPWEDHGGGIVGTRGDEAFLEIEPGFVPRIIACVNFCAGISAETLQRLIPLRETGIESAGAGTDALLGKKGGGQ